jgi:hypothetical protein
MRWRKLNSRVKRMIHRAALRVAWFEVREGIDWPGSVGRLIGSRFGGGGGAPAAGGGGGRGG